MENLHQNISIVNVVKQGVTLIEKDYSKDIIKDNKDLQKVAGLNNSYLEYVSQVVNASPIGARCLSVKKDYVYGAELTKSFLKISENETLLQLHKKLSNDIAFSHRFAVLIGSIFENGQVVSKKFTHLPIEWVRYSIPTQNGVVETVKYNPFYNTNEEMSRNELEYFIFENKETTKKRLLENIHNLQNNYVEEVYFYVETSEINRTYSHPYFFQAGENAFLADAGAWLFHRKNIENNFFLGGILQIQGRPDLEIEREDGTTTTLEQIITKKLQTMFAGGGSAGSIMTLFKNNAEESDIKYEPINSNNNDEKLLGLMGLFRQYIPTIMGVPAILAAVETAGKLGDSKEKEGAVKFMNDTTKDLRVALNDFYKTFFEGVEIIKIQEQLEIPNYIWNSLTEEQRQSYIQKNFPNLI